MADNEIQYYSSIEDVKEDSGIQPDDMGFEDTDNLTADEQLNNKIEKWLVDAKAYIDADRNRDFHLEVEEDEIDKIPVCIHSIAKRITINMANAAKLNRKSPIIKVNEYSVKPVPDDPMTAEIIKDLQTCAPATINPNEDSPFGCFVIDNTIVDE